MRRVFKIPIGPAEGLSEARHHGLLFTRGAIRLLDHSPDECRREVTLREFGGGHACPCLAVYEAVLSLFKRDASPAGFDRQGLNRQGLNRYWWEEKPADVHVGPLAAHPGVLHAVSTRLLPSPRDGYRKERIVALAAARRWRRARRRHLAGRPRPKTWLPPGEETPAYLHFPLMVFRELRWRGHDVSYEAPGRVVWKLPRKVPKNRKKFRVVFHYDSCKQGTEGYQAWLLKQYDHPPHRDMGNVCRVRLSDARTRDADFDIAHAADLVEEMYVYAFQEYRQGGRSQRSVLVRELLEHEFPPRKARNEPQTPRGPDARPEAEVGRAVPPPQRGRKKSQT